MQTNRTFAAINNPLDEDNGSGDTDRKAKTVFDPSFSSDDEN